MFQGTWSMLRQHLLPLTLAAVHTAEHLLSLPAPSGHTFPHHNRNDYDDYQTQYASCNNRSV